MQQSPSESPCDGLLQRVRTVGHVFPPRRDQVSQCVETAQRSQLTIRRLVKAPKANAVVGSRLARYWVQPFNALQTSIPSVSSWHMASRRTDTIQRSLLQRRSSVNGEQLSKDLFNWVPARLQCGDVMSRLPASLSYPSLPSQCLSSALFILRHHHKQACHEAIYSKMM